MQSSSELEGCNKRLRYSLSASSIMVLSLTIVLLSISSAGAATPPDSRADCSQIVSLDDPQGGISVGDFTYLMKYLFGGGPAPIVPHAAENVEGWSGITIRDAQWILNWTFASGPGIGCPCDAPGAWTIGAGLPTS